MTLSIEHSTNYHYSSDVFLNPHHLYFHPSQRSYLKTKSFQLDVAEGFDGLSERVDAENNLFHQVWFSGQHTSLDIKASMEVEISEFNPYDFLREPETQADERLQLYTNPLTEIGKPLSDWIQRQRETFGDDTLTFISGVNREIRQNWGHEIRYQAGIMTPDECFQSRDASCRDLCWMLMAILRQLKIPARFVSGYAFNPVLEDGHELHSWVEAWIPGAGWIGFDPVSGLLTNHFYIPVVSSFDPKYTLPVQGSYMGDATSKLETEVIITFHD